MICCPECDRPMYVGLVDPFLQEWPPMAWACCIWCGSDALVVESRPEVPFPTSR